MAGAVVVNVQSSESRAEIADGVDVNATGAVSVEAENGTISKVKANASMPMPLEIVLRGFDVGADLPAYSLTGHFFVMLDGSDGYVSAFDGFYQATFDGDTFESDYTRIEGIRENAPEVTVKADQAIWPEWTGEKTAEDIEGKQFELSYGLWYPIDDTAELFYAA